MSLIEEFIKEYGKANTYIEQKCMYEKYFDIVKDGKPESELKAFFRDIQKLFLLNFTKDEKLSFEDSFTFKVADAVSVPDAEEKIPSELKKYFMAKKLILTKQSSEAVNKLSDPTEKSEDAVTNTIAAFLLTVKGEAFYTRGEKDDIDKAIDCFNEAKKLDENYALVHLCLAISLFKKYKDINYKDKDNDLEKELHIAETLGAKAQVAEQLGYMYQQYGDKENMKKAVSNYEKAIDWDPCMNIALRFLVPYYCNIMQNEKASNILERAGNLMPNNDPNINFLRGSVLLKKGERERNNNKAEEYLKKARECLEKAKWRYEVLNDRFYESISDELLKEITFDDETREKLEKYKNDPVANILWQTIVQRIDYTVFHNQEKFLDFIAPKLSETVSQDITFEVHRRWNSYTPIIADNHHSSRGGGYFFRIKGKGIVVDPGFNFIDNFREAGHRFHEIDAVLITHAHNDHTADLESILTLLHRYNKEFRGKKTFNRENTIRADMAIFRNKSIRCGIKDDEDKEEVEKFIKECNEEFGRRKKIIDLFLTKSTMDKYNGLLNLRSDKDYRLHVIEAKLSKDRLSDRSFINCDKIKFDSSKITIGDAEIDKCVQIEVITAKHDDIISDRDAVGFIFDFKEIKTVLIITGDTGWSKEIKNQYSDLSKKYESYNKIILVAHLGGFDAEEKDYVTNFNPDAEITSPPFYKHHLGRLGLASLIKTIKPHYCFISEFGEEFKGKRIELANIFGQVFKDYTVILPVDNGFIYDVVNDQVNVITEVNPVNCELRNGYVDLKNVGVGTFYKDYSLQYYFKKSRGDGERRDEISESDVMQVLAQIFEKKRF